MFQPSNSDEMVVSPKVYVLGDDLYHRLYNDLGILEPFKQRDGWYYVFQDGAGHWWLYLRKGFRHNGADWFPDYDFMLFPSAIHDVCLWLIDWGIIPEENNDLVDRELYDCIIHTDVPMPWFKGGSNKWARRWEARRIKLATHLARTSAGEQGSLEFKNRTLRLYK